MHSAPAVRYPVPRSARAGGALALLCLLAMAVWLGWWRAGAPAPARVGVALCLLVCAAVAGLQWRGMWPGHLRWDGQGWWWQADGIQGQDEQAVVVDVRLDLQSGALVHLKGARGRVHWLYLERRVLPPRWSDLRRALHGSSAGAVQA